MLQRLRDVKDMLQRSAGKHHVVLPQQMRGRLGLVQVENVIRPFVI